MWILKVSIQQKKSVLNCGGACCDHSAPMGAKLKRIADSFTAKYWDLPEDLKSSALIKSTVLKWVLLDRNPQAQTLNKMINVHIDAVRLEKNVEKRKALAEALDKLNEQFEKHYGDKTEAFIPVTNHSLANEPENVLYNITDNVCMFKDHKNTNRCTIYNGVRSASGENIERPYACTAVGSLEHPCPWLNPKKLNDVVRQARENLASNGYDNLPNKVINDYVAQQYNLNQTWYEKIYQPFLKEKNV